MKRLVKRALAALAIIGLWNVAGCSDQADVARSGQRPTTEASDSGTLNRRSPRSDTLADQPTCLPLRPAKVWLTGTVRREERFGPPGYGETPRVDEKDTILVLHLQEPISVCPDSVAGREDRERREASVLQLTGSVQRAWSHLGHKISVHGALFRAELGWHYTDVLMQVDTVSSAPEPPPSVTAIRARDEAHMAATFDRCRKLRPWRASAEGV